MPVILLLCMYVRIILDIVFNLVRVLLCQVNRNARSIGLPERNNNDIDETFDIIAAFNDHCSGRRIVL